MTNKSIITALMIIMGHATGVHAAGNAGASLAACTDHVVSTCNSAGRPALCAANGLKACEKLHGSKTTNGSGSAEGRRQGLGQLSSE